MTLRTNGFSVAGIMWTSTQQMCYPWRQVIPRMCATAGKARLVTVDSLTGSTTRRLAPAERRDRRPGWSVMLLVGTRCCSVSTRFCTPGWRSWTELAPGCAASADRLMRQWCGQIGGGDMSVAQPHLATNSTQQVRYTGRPARMLLPKFSCVSTKLTISIRNVSVGSERRFAKADKARQSSLKHCAEHGTTSADHNQCGSPDHERTSHWYGMVWYQTQCVKTGLFQWNSCQSRSQSQWTLWLASVATADACYMSGLVWWVHLSAR